MLIIALGLYVITCLRELKALIHDATTVDSQVVRLAEESLNALYEQAGSAEKYLISRDKKYHDQALNKIEFFNKTLVGLRAVASDQETKRLLEELARLQARHLDLFEMTAVQIKRNQRSDTPLPKFRRGENQLLDEMDKRLRGMAKLSARAQTDKLYKSEEISSRVNNVIAITEIAAVLLVFLISFLNTKSISRPIAVLRDKTRLIAAGNFDQPANISSPPELKELADAYNLMCERLKELDQMKLDFISHLSHELRTPLTAMKESSCMLLDGTFANAPEKQQELLSIMKDECNRLIGSVTRILDLSRLEAGMMEFFFEVSDMGPAIERTVNRFLPLAHSKKIDIVLDLQQDLPSVKMDEEKIETVLDNLLSNAFKFTPDGGTIKLTARRNTEKHRFEVSVSDTGPGIPEEGLKEVFEKFKRVDEKKGSVRGTGLGLAIVKHIVNAHGGQAWAESAAGRGSTFTFSLPLL